jgi:hypothetical protein
MEANIDSAGEFARLSAVFGARLEIFMGQSPRRKQNLLKLEIEVAQMRHDVQKLRVEAATLRNGQLLDILEEQQQVAHILHLLLKV